MGPNDVELARVYTREAGGTISDRTFPVNQDFEIAVDVEAGNAIFGGGTQFSVGVVLRDETANDDIPATLDPAIAFPGTMGTADWPTQAHQFTFKVAAADLAGRENHCAKVIAFLQARLGDPDVSFAETELFILTTP